MKKYILIGFIFGAIIFGSIGVAANQIFSNEITFTPNNSNWTLPNNTVEDAINDLYNRTKITDNISLTKVATYASSNTSITIPYNPEYYCYYVIDICWYTSSRNFDPALSMINITSTTNSNLISLGYTGRNGSESSAAARGFLVFPDGSGEDITLYFNSVDSIDIYGIK